MNMYHAFSFSHLDPRQHCIFLDHDGTSALFVPPEQAHEAYPLPGFKQVVEDLIDTGFKLAYVSGRPIETPFLDKPCGSLQRFYGDIPASGLHGLEFRPYPFAQVERPEGLPLIDQATWKQAEKIAAATGAMIEYKARTNLCFHVASLPQAEQEAALQRFAEGMKDFLAANPIYKLQAGRGILELCPGELVDGAKVDKGAGVERFMALPDWKGLRPIGFGDDAKRVLHDKMKIGTDEALFKAVQEHGGIGVLVGPQVLTARAAAWRRRVSLTKWLY